MERRRASKSKDNVGKPYQHLSFYNRLIHGMHANNFHFSPQNVCRACGRKDPTERKVKETTVKVLKNQLRPTNKLRCYMESERGQGRKATRHALVSTQ
jgi:hypothetical protein